MIVDFTVENFKSIKSEVMLSMYAEKNLDSLSDNYSYPDTSKKIATLRVASIYGANASGKTNILDAFSALGYIANITGDLKEDEAISVYQPYSLSEEARLLPTKFEIEFVLSGKRYIYKVVFNKNEIIEESLDFFPGKNKANIFNRKKGQTWQQISFGMHYKGGTKTIPLFKNNSYLSKAGNNAGSPLMIRDVFNYFRTNIHFVGLNRHVSILDWQSNAETVQNMSTILNKIDTGITNITFKEMKYKEAILKGLEGIPKEIQDSILKDLAQQPKFEHKTDTGESVYFDESKESEGTKQLFKILPILLDIFKKGSVLLWDELESKLHPHIAELVIKLFNDPMANNKHAQLIFSTHNLQLMKPNLLRKDQIWVAEKQQGVTSLTSLDEFSDTGLKSSSPYAKWYDDGRLGAVPEINYAVISNIFSSNISHIDPINERSHDQ